MNRTHILGTILVSLFLLPLQWSYGAGVGDVTIKLNGGSNVAYIGENNTLEVWIQNDAPLSLMSMCFKIDINRDYTWVKPYGTKPAALPVVKEEGDAVGKFADVGGLQIIDRIYNTKPDSILINGNSTPNLPAHAASTLCYTLRFSISSSATPSTGGVCIDNIVFPPSGYWAFMDENLFAPKFQGNGNANISNPTAPPICFDIVQRPNVPPVFNNCPSTLGGPICNLLTYDFDAFDPDGTPVTYSVFSGPGTVSPTTGVWSYTAGSAAGVGSLTIRATDSTGSFRDCTTSLTYTDNAPSFTNTCADTVSGGQGQNITYTFHATDPNSCDVLTYALLSVTPTPTGTRSVNSGSGLLSFTPAVADVGSSYTFLVTVNDGDMQDTCTVVALAVASLATDTDQDTQLNSSDNCPHTYNPTQADADFDGIGNACDANATCGDSNGDTTLNISDVVFLIQYIFSGGPAPSPLCSSDITGEGLVNITDVVSFVNFIFAGSNVPDGCCCPAGSSKYGPYYAVNTTGSIKRGVTVDMNGTANSLANAKVTDFPPGARILTVDCIQNKVSIDFQINVVAPNDSVGYYVCSPTPPAINTVTWR